MYELLCRSSERPWAPQPEKLEFVPERGASKPLILHMQENRSHLTQEARLCFSVIALLFMVTSIGPALPAAADRFLSDADAGGRGGGRAGGAAGREPL